jgi:excisionase family DNA binding protein
MAHNRSGPALDSAAEKSGAREADPLGSKIGLEKKVPHLRDAIRTRRDGANRIRFFTIANVAESLSVSSRTVRRWIDAEELIAHRFNGVLRISDADLHAFLARHREG